MAKRTYHKGGLILENEAINVTNRGFLLDLQCPKAVKMTFSSTIGKFKLGFTLQNPLFESVCKRKKSYAETFFFWAILLSMYEDFREFYRYCASKNAYLVSIRDLKEGMSL